MIMLGLKEYLISAKHCMKTRGLNNNIDFTKAFLEVRSTLMGGKEDQDIILHYLGCRSGQCLTSWLLLLNADFFQCCVHISTSYSQIYFLMLIFFHVNSKKGSTVLAVLHCCWVGKGLLLSTKKSTFLVMLVYSQFKSGGKDRRKNYPLLTSSHGCQVD